LRNLRRISSRELLPVIDERFATHTDGGPCRRVLDRTSLKPQADTALVPGGASVRLIVNVEDEMGTGDTLGDIRSVAHGHIHPGLPSTEKAAHPDANTGARRR